MPETALIVSNNPSAFLRPVNLTELRLALDILAQYSIHAGLPPFSGLPKVGDHLRAVTHREQHLATGQLRASPAAPDQLVPLNRPGFRGGHLV